MTGIDPTFLPKGVFGSIVDIIDFFLSFMDHIKD